MEEFSRCGAVGKAAMKADMNRKTAAKYLKSKKLPSESGEPRNWRTRPDPFEDDWEEIEAMLEASPELEALTIFEDLLERKPERYVPGQLRTLQRRVRRWRALHGPGKEIFFPQLHRPGEAAQTDFTNAGELRVTICGEAFAHLLCHTVLPYSLWQSVTPCQSESMASLRRGLQTSLFKLGRVPEFHQTDNSTGATHNVGRKERKQTGATEERTGLPKTRAFNDEYLELMKHFGLTPRTTAVGAKEQNGTVEASNGATKRYIEQQLILRGSRDFASVDAYGGWLNLILDRKNKQRAAKVAEDLAAMRVLRVARLAEFTEVDVQVTQGSTIRVKRNTYSINSRLIGERVRVRVYDERIEAYFGGELQLQTSRLLGDGGCKINYRHVIESLVRKPGAFERWRYRDELFPTLTFREGYDVLHEACESNSTGADLEYLRILHLAGRNIESDVERGLRTILDSGKAPSVDAVRALVIIEKPEVPTLATFQVDLGEYDHLIQESSEQMLAEGRGLRA
jgi:hypothetical protein